MPDPAINVARVVYSLERKYGCDSSGKLNPYELDLFDALDDFIVNAIDGGRVSVENVSFLSYDCEFEKETVNEDLENEEQGSDEEFSCDKLGSYQETPKVTPQYKKDAVAFWRSGRRKKVEHSRVSETTLNSLQMSEFYTNGEKQIAEGGTQAEKLDEVSKVWKEKFDAPYETQIIHDMNIQLWAIQAAHAIGLKNFKASDTWLYNFKMKHNIVSRKITKVTTSKKLNAEMNTFAKVVEFVESVKSTLQNFDSSQIFNCDQSGFNLEMTRGRTLAVKGEKSVHCRVQSINAITHSYTILPTVSASGSLIPPLLIVLQEKMGVFGPRVKETIFHFENIKVTCTPSGKMGTKEMKSWYETVFCEHISAEKSALLADAFSGHSCLKDINTDDKQVQVFSIPAGTTGFCQLLDVFGFRFWKVFVRRLSSDLRLLDPTIVLSHRNNILKLQSLTCSSCHPPALNKLGCMVGFGAGISKMTQGPSKIQ